MSKVFYVAIGGLLVLVAATILLIQAGGVPGDPTVIRIVAAVFGVPGTLLLAVGLRSPFPDSARHLVRRKLTLRNLALGPFVVAASIATLYVCLWVLPIAPDALIFGAGAGLLAGIFLTASVQGDACVACNRLLQSVTAHFPPERSHLLTRIVPGEARAAIQALGTASQEGSAAFTFHVCTQCREVAVVRSATNEVTVLTGSDARALAELASQSGATKNHHQLF
ncbi:MAG: hypothetical protein HYU52_11530 [Acidobacteria bacterium]|nr:hypothetical protein [Acidobacteriota bacterium]